MFHRGSAGINPLGAHARPVKPLPKRRASAITEEIQGKASVLARVGVEGISNKHTPTPDSLQPDVDGMQLPHPRPPRPSGRTVTTALLASRLGPTGPVSNRIVSGSFGSFEGGGLSRFDERKYRLLQGSEKGTDEQGKKGDDGDAAKAAKANVFKKMPWLW